MTDSHTISHFEPAAAMARLVREDAIGALRRKQGAMAHLGSEGDTLKLDWVEMLPWLLAHPNTLANVEREAADMIAQGTRHLIWAGMGGSVLSVQVMQALGYADGPCKIHPLDSTDPAALNAILRAIGDDLDHTSMIGVALGMTSEEPIGHLQWFAGVLADAGLDPAAHQLVMALPGSYLDRYASEHGVQRWPLQLDGGSGIGGRMSAPGTRVFLLPAALYLAGLGAEPGALAALLCQAWQAYDLDSAEANPEASQWAQLAVALAGRAVNGAVRLSMATQPGWEALRDWTEQLMEESLGKGGKGVVVFAPEAMPSDAPATLKLHIVSDPDAAVDGADLVITEPLIGSADPRERLAGLAALYLGLQLTMALYGYLWNITFSGQPAVEAYKSRARALRDSAEPALAQTQTIARQGYVAFSPMGRLSLFNDLRTRRVQANAARETSYLDLTINGEAETEDLAQLEAQVRAMALERMKLPYKLRRAPASYHSTEQSEMDGPVSIFSYRALALGHEAVTRGTYSPRFLEAQAVATWRAMSAQGRQCTFMVYDGAMSEMLAALSEFFAAMNSAWDSGLEAAGSDGEGDDDDEE